MGYNPNIHHFEVGYIPFTNHLLSSWGIQVASMYGVFTYMKTIKNQPKVGL